MCSLEDLREVVERCHKVIHVNTCGRLSETDYEGSKLKNIVSNRHVEWVGKPSGLRFVKLTPWSGRSRGYPV